MAFYIEVPQDECGNVSSCLVSVPDGNIMRSPAIIEATEETDQWGCTWLTIIAPDELVGKYGRLPRTFFALCEGPAGAITWARLHEMWDELGLAKPSSQMAGPWGPIIGAVLDLTVGKSKR